jgi:hypothetical protein
MQQNYIMTDMRQTGHSETAGVHLLIGMVRLRALSENPPNAQSYKAPERDYEQKTECDTFGCPEGILNFIGTRRVLPRNFHPGWIAQERY